MFFRRFGAKRFFLGTLGERVKQFPMSNSDVNKIAFVAGSAAIVLTSMVTWNTEKIIDKATDKIDSFMMSYGNRLFLEMMANKKFRETVYAIREAEMLYYGIWFEKNEKNAVFYRGMTIADEFDAKNPAKVEKWQNSILNNMTGPGFSPLIWLTRPSATKERGFNTHPHDGNVTRLSAPDTPPSWSAAVMAMTCDFGIVKGYSALGSLNEFNQTGCIVLCAPKEITYLSSTDVRSRHKLYRGHEFEIITPYIDSEDILAILFVEHGKISRIEINENIMTKQYAIDPHLIENLKKQMSSTEPRARDGLKYFIETIEERSKKIDLAHEFESRFNDSVDELRENTQKSIAKCDEKIDKMPGILGAELRAIRIKHKLLSREEVATRLDVPLTSGSDVETEHISKPK